MTTAQTPTPKTSRRGAAPFSPFALAVCLLAALFCASAATARTDSPSEEVLETVRTPAGELSLARSRAGEGVTIRIRLGGRVIAEKSASREGDAYEGASLRGLYPRGAPRYALVGLSTGSLVCGAKFAVVDLSRGAAAARVTEEFGNCSDAPRVAYRGGALTIAFPAGPKRRDPGTHYVGPGQVWTYAGGRLRRAGAR